VDQISTLSVALDGLIDRLSFSTLVIVRFFVAIWFCAEEATAEPTHSLCGKRSAAVNDDDRFLKLSASNEELTIFVIRVVCIGLLGYWSLILIRPFLTVIVWSIIITVALYPIFDWLSAKLYGHHALAAIAITVFTLIVMLGPVT
jgi:hypothetical protein